MKPIRWGVLGTGPVAEDFIAGLKALEGAELQAVGSNEQATADEFAARHGAAKAYGSYEAVADDPSVDIVYISTTNNRHYGDILHCLNRGKAVVCDKPFTLDAAQARRVVEAARERKVFCMEGMWMRFMPLLGEFRDRIKAGAVGRPLVLSSDFGVPTQFDPSNPFFNPDLGGGALLDRGVYLISLAFWLFGPPDSVAAAAIQATTGVDDSVGIVLGYNTGQMAVLKASLSAKMNNGATVYGALGRITLSEPFFAPEEMVLELHGGPKPPAQRRALKSRLIAVIKRLPVIAALAKRLRGAAGVKSISMPHGDSAYRFEAAEAMRCLRAGLTESPIIPLDETVRILECLDQVREALGKTA